MNYQKSPKRKVMPTLKEELSPPVSDSLPNPSTSQPTMPKKIPVRPRSGSASAKSTVTKAFQRFRKRSQSMSHKAKEDDKDYGPIIRAIGTVAARITQLNPKTGISQADEYRDSRGLPNVNTLLSPCMEAFKKDENLVYSTFFRLHRCYSLMPTSGKVVVFSFDLVSKKAFQALVENGVRAAILWDPYTRKHVGMLTTTDFIRILSHWDSQMETEFFDLEEMRIETWREALGVNKRPFILIGPDTTLYDAVKVLINHHIHRLPVVCPKTNNVLYVLTHKRALRFLYYYLKELPGPSMLYETIGNLKIGTFNNVITAKEYTSIREAFILLLENNVSALPIVDDEDKLVDIYAKFDAINLAAEKSYDNLDITVLEAISYRNPWFEGVSTCRLENTLLEVIVKIVDAEVHRLVVVDDDNKVLGMLSLSDLLITLLKLENHHTESPQASLKDATSTPVSPNQNEKERFSKVEDKNVSCCSIPSQTASLPEKTDTASPPMIQRRHSLPTLSEAYELSEERNKTVKRKGSYPSELHNTSKSVELVTLKVYSHEEGCSKPQSLLNLKTTSAKDHSSVLNVKKRLEGIVKRIELIGIEEVFDSTEIVETDIGIEATEYHERLEKGSDDMPESIFDLELSPDSNPPPDSKPPLL